jgi:hypothetical protein
MSINFGGSAGVGGSANPGPNNSMYGGQSGTLYGQLNPIQNDPNSPFSANAQKFQREQLGTQQAGETQRANIAANAQMLPAELQQQRFQQVLPLLSGQIGSSQNPYTIGGQIPQGPTIGANGVYNPAQIQQQVNTQRAANDQSTGTQQRAMTQQLAGRGYGANSPLAQALGTSMQNQNQQTNTANETQTRLGAQQANVQQQFAGQQAQQQQFAQGQQLNIERAAPYFARQQALIAALGSMA